MKNKVNLILVAIIIVIFTIYLYGNILAIPEDIAVWFHYIKGISEQKLILYKDIYEINFPGILIFQYPAYTLFELTGYKSPFFFYILNIEIVLIFIGFLVSKIEKDFSKGLWFVLISLLLVYDSIGQRDYIIIILSIPYILIKLNYLNNNKI